MSYALLRGTGVLLWFHLAICSLPPLSMSREIWAGFICEHTLLQQNPPFGAIEMANVTSAPVLLFKMRCMFFFLVKTCLCALSKEITLSFSSLSANPFLWRPLLYHVPCLVRLSLIFFLNGTIDSAIPFS